MADDILKPIGGDTSEVTLKPLDDPLGGEKKDDAFKSEMDVMVYSMPKQFKGAKESKNVTPHEEKKKGGSKKFLIILIILILLLGGGAAAAYFLIIIPNQVQNAGESIGEEIQEVLGEAPVEDPTQPEEEFIVVNEPVIEEDLEENDPGSSEYPGSLDPPLEPIEPEPESTTDDGLVQKIAVSYDEDGNKITEAVLSLETEVHVNYGQVTIAEYIVELHVHPEYFSAVAGKPYEVLLRGEETTAKSVLTITYTDALLENLDLIPADLRIGYLAPDMLTDPGTSEVPGSMSQENETSTSEMTEEVAPVEVWEILKAQDLNTELNSISSIIDGVEEGIYAIVPIHVNDIINGTTQEEVVLEPEEDEEVSILPGLDSDEDLLTDTEELLYGTSPTVTDSDLDGYDDGAEVLVLFSPARGEGVTLEEDVQFDRYIHATSTFSILLPNSFARTELEGESYGDVLIQIGEGETIFIGPHDNPAGLSLMDWVVLQSPEIDTAVLETFTLRGGNAALVVPDKTTYYVIAGETQVYVFSYSAAEVYNYFTTFRMMVESFEAMKSE